MADRVVQLRDGMIRELPQRKTGYLQKSWIAREAVPG